MSHVFVAMSGGVDSSVAALLLQQAGHKIFGVNLRMFHNEDLGQSPGKTCCSLADAEDAGLVARRLGAPFYVFDVSQVFRSTVIRDFIEEYQNGRTPNPCAVCNRTVKFGALLDRVRVLGADYLATGHYARVEQDAATGRYLLKRGLDRSKDQSYFLYMLTQEQLAHTLFPLGGLEKTQVRQLAEAHGLVNAHKHDSQDICFIPDGNHMKFIEEYTHKKVGKGNFLDINGKVIGQHNGYYRYTVGQRKGINVNRDGKHYVLEIRPETNEVVVGRNKDLFTGELVATDFNWISGEAPTGEVKISGRTRYHQPLTEGVAKVLENGDVKVSFDEPIRAITKGQSVVLYDGDVVLGGGTIKEC